MDKGVQFVLNEFEKSLRISRNTPRLSKLVKRIESEYNRIKETTKTGDLYDHFIEFEYEDHAFKKDFEVFKDYGILTNEEMAEQLRIRFPEEINNRSSISDMIVGNEYSNNYISQIFKVTPYGGGIRSSSKTKTIVITSFHGNGIYEDHWAGDVLHYTGQGQIGDQELKSGNKSIIDAASRGLTIHLFEVFKPKRFYYHGIVELESHPYIAEQLDINKNNRKVYMFPLKIKKTDDTPLVEKKTLDESYEEALKDVQKLNDKELEERARQASKHPEVKRVLSNYVERNPAVAEHAKRRANGICDLCSQPAPFKNKNGEPYLESHHIIYLAKGGVDTIYNTVALCPNCHRKVHALEDKMDISKLISKVGSYLKKTSDESVYLEYQKYFDFLRKYLFVQMGVRK